MSCQRSSGVIASVKVNGVCGTNLPIPCGLEQSSEQLYHILVPCIGAGGARATRCGSPALSPLQGVEIALRPVVMRRDVPQFTALWTPTLPFG